MSGVAGEALCLTYELLCFLLTVECDNRIDGRRVVRDIGGFDVGLKQSDELFVCGGGIDASDQDRCARDG